MRGRACVNARQASGDPDVTRNVTVTFHKVSATRPLGSASATQATWVFHADTLVNLGATAAAVERGKI